MIKKTLLGLTILVLLMASCAAGEASRSVEMDGADFYYEEEAAESAPMAPEPYDDEAQRQNIADSTSAANPERMVIQNADLSIIAEDPAQSMDEIGKMAESMGGYIVESYLYQQTLSSGAQVPHATITIRVPAEKLECVARIVSAFPEVNHNYEREHEYNLWFVVTASSEEHLDIVLYEIEQHTEFPLMSLPMLEDYFIDLGFQAPMPK